MEIVPFFTPVYFSNGPSNIKEDLLEKVDSYFYFGGKKAEFISVEDGIHLIKYTEKKQSLLITVVKVVSYLAIILPIIALAVKYVLRKALAFDLHSALKNTSSVSLNDENASFINLDKKVIGSTSDTAKITLKDGSSFFWKAWRDIGDKFAGYRDIVGSKIANLLTGGSCSCRKHDIG